MNAAVAYRATLYGLDQPLGLPPGARRRNNGNVEAGAGAQGSPAATERNNARRRTFIPLNWVEYKDHCAEQADTKPESIFDVVWDVDAEIPSVGEQAWRMLTIYPYRDAIWVVKILFTLGGSMMAISATLGLVTALRKAAPSRTQQQPLGFDIATATLLTTDLGLVLLLMGGSLALVATLNAQRGAMEPVDVKLGALEPPKAYKPALLGARSWVWAPTGADLRALWAKVPFRAGFINWLGLLTFQIVVVDTIPGILDPADFRQTQLAVQLPLFVGFALLVVANFTLMVWLQERWYKPKLGKASWLSAFLATVGSFSLSLSPVYQSMGFVLPGAWANFIGRWVFFVAILVGFYDLMAFHPNAWAGISIYGRR